MEKIDFKLNNEQEYITLVNLLKATSLINSGGEVKYYLSEEKVSLNGTLVTEKRKKILSR